MREHASNEFTRLVKASMNMLITIVSRLSKSVLILDKSRLRGALEAAILRSMHEGSRLPRFFGTIGTTPAKCLGYFHPSMESVLDEIA